MNNVSMQAVVKTFPQVMSILAASGLTAQKRIGGVYEHRFSDREKVRIVESGLSIEMVLSVMKDGTKEFEDAQWVDMYSITIGREVHDDPNIAIYMNRELIDTIEFSFVDVDGYDKCRIVSSSSSEPDYSLEYSLDVPEEVHFQNSLLHVVPDYSFMHEVKSTYQELRNINSSGYAYISLYLFSGYGSEREREVQDGALAESYLKWIMDYTMHYEVSRNLALLEKEFELESRLAAEAEASKKIGMELER